jgi:hypothetical protein
MRCPKFPTTEVLRTLLSFESRDPVYAGKDILPAYPHSPSTIWGEDDVTISPHAIPDRGRYNFSTLIDKRPNSDSDVVEGAETSQTLVTKQETRALPVQGSGREQNLPGSG